MHKLPCPPPPHAIHKMSFNWIVDLLVKEKIITLLKNNIKYLHGFGVVDIS